jgi:exodeoxyribonuclease VII large subunit
MIASAIFRPGGMGLLSKELEALKIKLQAEGLFDAGRKRPIPVAPVGIALVTSRSGAVLHDVLRVLRHSAPLSRLVLVHAAVQGATAPAEIVAAMQRANALARAEARAGRADAPSVILLARGGGSSDDLAAFSAEPVLRAIAASELPVLSAVGHESDITLADLVADDRAGTPSIGAARLAPNLDALRRKPLQLAAYARDAVEIVIARAAAALGSEGRALASAGPSARLERAGEQLALTVDDLHRGARGRLQRAIGEVQQAGLLLGALSPLGILSRGYAMVEGEDGSLVRSWRQVPSGRGILIRLAEGELSAQVTKSGKGGRDGGKAS